VTVPSLCPVGYYCPRLTGTVTAGSVTNWEDYYCPSGTFNDREGLRSIEDCQDVGFGKYGPDGTDGRGFVTRDQGTRCDAGYYCYTDVVNLHTAESIAASHVHSSETRMNSLPCPLGQSCSGGNILGDKCPPG
jgi:hypothetical protein